MKAPDSKTILDSFPHPTLPKIIGKPNYQQLDDLEKKLKSNAASVQTLLGEDNLDMQGHLC